jgi:hypothetical protein
MKTIVNTTVSLFAVALILVPALALNRDAGYTKKSGTLLNTYLLASDSSLFKIDWFGNKTFLKN